MTLMTSPRIGKRSAPAWTLARLARRFGSIPIDRIRLNPKPGSARKEDVLAIHDRENRLCELYDGVLVEKTVGFHEAYLASEIASILRSYIKPRNLGIVLADGGMIEILADQVRIPDVSFIAWQSLPDRTYPDEPIPAIVPDLAVEILSPSNSVVEMRRKLDEYRESGVKLVWYVDPKTESVRAWNLAAGQTEPTILGRDATLDGVDVLPGFSLSLAELFAKPEAPAAEPSSQANDPIR
jgi:Uma2 family endonuclease